MTKDSVLFSLVGIGFGLFMGFAFASWANQRSGAAARTPEQSRQLPSNAVADQERLRTEAEESAKLARENPQSFDAQMQAARSYNAAERFDDSIEFLLRANTIQPNNIDPVIALAHVNANAGNFPVAEKWHKAALQMKPDDAALRTDLGRFYLLKEPPDYALAVAELRRVLERDPRNAPSLQLLVVAFARKGETQEARAALAKLEGIDPADESLPSLRQEIETSAAGAAAPAGGVKSGR